VAKKITRTAKLQVRFSGLRKADVSSMYRKLWDVQRDLLEAGNRAIGLLMDLARDQIKRPVEPPARGGDPRPVPERTLAYRAITGSWAPYGEPCYRRDKTDPLRVHSSVLLGTAGKVYTRYKTDRLDVLRGKKSSPSFRSGYGGRGRGGLKGLPIPFQSGVKLLPNNRIRLPLFAGRKNNSVTVYPVKTDAWLKAIFRKLYSGDYKLGSAELCWDQPRGRKGGWFLSLSWTDLTREVPELETSKPTPFPEGDKGVVIAGVDTGIRHAAWVAFLRPDGTPLKRPEHIEYPKRVLRALVRIERERRQRAAWNRLPLGLREGRGQIRKLRVNCLGDTKAANIKRTMLREIAAAIVAACRKRGATVIVLEQHTVWSVSKMNDRAWELSANRSEAARARAAFYRWNEGTLSSLIKEVAEREGLLVVMIDPAWTTRTCHACGVVWKRDWINHPPEEGEIPSGRIKLRRFHCSPEATSHYILGPGKVIDLPDEPRKGCGYDGYPNHNSAINIARRGIDRMRDPSLWNPDTPLVGRPNRKGRVAK